jgi:hypothetical protein
MKTLRKNLGVALVLLVSNTYNSIDLSKLEVSFTFVQHFCKFFLIFAY